MTALRSAVFRRHVALLCSCAMIAVASPAAAQLPHESTPGVPNTDPPVYVSTSNPQLTAVGGPNDCAWQYIDEINRLAGLSLTTDYAGLGLNAIGAAADVAGLIAQEVAAAAEVIEFGVMAGGLAAAAAAVLLDVPVVGTAAGASVGLGVAAGAATALAATGGVEAIALGANILGAGSTVAGVAAEIAAVVYAQQAYDLEVHQSGLPFCDTEFTGTIMTHANVIANMGVHAHNGRISLGYYEPFSGTENPAEYYYDGITLGGGGLGGAGHGSTYGQAYTGHVDAIGIGNGARAPGAFDTVVGTGSVINGAGGSNTVTGANNTSQQPLQYGGWHGQPRYRPLQFGGRHHERHYRR